jgi:hypothetical protein
VESSAASSFVTLAVIAGVALWIGTDNRRYYRTIAITGALTLVLIVLGASALSTPVGLPGLARLLRQSHPRSFCQ